MIIVIWGLFLKLFWLFKELFFNCSSIVIEVSEPFINFFKSKNTPQKYLQKTFKAKTKAFKAKASTQKQRKSY